MSSLLPCYILNDTVLQIWLFSTPCIWLYFVFLYTCIQCISWFNLFYIPSHPYTHTHTHTHTKSHSHLQTHTHTDTSGMSCDATCRDDADCPHKQKCCGFCGSVCVDPVDVLNCGGVEAAEMEKLKLLDDSFTKGARGTNSEFLGAQIKLTMMTSVWLPACQADRERFFPKQVSRGWGSGSLLCLCEMDWSMWYYIKKILLAQNLVTFSLVKSFM